MSWLLIIWSVCVFQGGKSEIFVDVIERMTVVIGSNVSNISVRRTVTPEKLKNGQKCLWCSFRLATNKTEYSEECVSVKNINYKRFLR